MVDLLTHPRPRPERSTSPGRRGPAGSGWAANRRSVAKTARRRARAAEQGWTLLAVVISIGIVTVALVNHALLAGQGALVSRQARNQFACREAATALLNGPVPAEQGGTLPPATRIEGWYDRIYIDPRSGRIVPFAGEAAAGATLVERRWRLGPDAEGRRVLEVTATAIGPDFAPLERHLAAAITLSKRVR